MNSFTAGDWYDVTGRGRVAAVDTRHLPVGEFVNIGDVVDIDGTQYAVKGIESSRILTHPPRMAPVVGLLVVPV